MPFFAVRMVNGPGWDPAHQRRAQPGWDEHAAFMDRLRDEGFVVLGGPIGDADQVLLAVEAGDHRDVEARLHGDPWLAMGILRIGVIEPWTIWLDGRQTRDRRPTPVETTTIAPELWVDRGEAALEFYQAAFGARVLHRVGTGDDIVTQLAVDDASFWIAVTDSGGERLVPRDLGGATGRLLIVVPDPDAVFDRAVAAGARGKSEVAVEHGWRVGRVIDPFGHEWEIGRPLIPWPPDRSRAR
ncbi:MAG TPA: VOC family protein [Jatrophihabitans sp.]|nr:VOC family protein [Jatrophihabitans sp.]